MEVVRAYYNKKQLYEEYCLINNKDLKRDKIIFDINNIFFFNSLFDNPLQKCLICISNKYFVA